VEEQLIQIQLMDLMITRWSNDMYEINSVGDTEICLEDAVLILLDHAATYICGPDEEPMDIKFLSVSSCVFED
jgi:hypothetical protein